MGLKTKLKTFFLLDEEENEIMEEEAVQKQPVQEPIRETIKRQQSVQPSQAPRQNVVSLQSIQKQSKVILVEPRVYAEAQEIADHLNNHRSVVVNLQRIQHDQALRIVDFLSGTVYAIGGDIQRVGSNIFLCTPDTVEVTGNITELLQENDLHDSRWS